MFSWFFDTFYWLYHDLIIPLMDFGFWYRWLFTGDMPLAISLLVLNSLFLILRLFDTGSGKSDGWNSGPSLVFQTGLIVANASLIAVDASMRGWI